MSANPVFPDSHTAPLPGSDVVRIRGFPGEFDDPLRWRVPGDYTRPAGASTPPWRVRATLDR